MGFFYMFMLLLQGSLFLTKFHVNRWWTMTLECFAAFHGATVAYASVTQDSGQWANFLFGGVAVFLITQMHGVRLTRTHKLIITALCLGLMGWYYAENQEKILNMPGLVIFRYTAVFVTALLIWLIMRPFIWSGKKLPGVPQKTGGLKRSYSRRRSGGSSMGGRFFLRLPKR